MVIVTASGAVDLDRAVFRTPGVNALIITTERGRDRLEIAGGERLGTTRVAVLAAPGDRIEPLSILNFLVRNAVSVSCSTRADPRCSDNSWHAVLWMSQSSCLTLKKAEVWLPGSTRRCTEGFLASNKKPCQNYPK